MIVKKQMKGQEKDSAQNEKCKNRASFQMRLHDVPL
jgi:hypothetical protein